MDRKLASLLLAVYSLSNYLSFCAVAFPGVRIGAFLVLLLVGAVIALIGFLNYLKTVKDGIQSGDGFFGDKDSFILGAAPSIFFGVAYLAAIITGIYLGWQ